MDRVTKTKVSVRQLPAPLDLLVLSTGNEFNETLFIIISCILNSETKDALLFG